MSTPERFPTLDVSGAVRRLVVVFGDQLTHDSEAFDDFDHERDAVLMIESATESTHVASHRQRTVYFLASMRHFALELHERDVRVRYITLDDPANTQELDSEVRRAVDALAPEELVCAEPGEWRVQQMVDEWDDLVPGGVRVVSARHFLVSSDAFAAWAAGRRSFVMEHFYRKQREELKVLMTADGEPEGGTWNFDHDNRAALDAAPDVRPPYRPRTDAITREVIDLVARELPDLPGRVESFPWPVTRRTAKRALDDFIEHRLPNFGTYQDAMWRGENALYHSRLSAAINVMWLHPRDCVDAAVAAYRAGAAPLNAVEGFVRQIIGWREFIRGVYWYEGAAYGARNGLDQHGALPSFYWDGDTEMACLRDAIGRVLDEGYGHHIERLMITGNFALLAGVHPRAISDWYLGMYVDAIDWVTLPNTLGMAMHADGGVVGTKPYAASGKYVKRMSNFCDDCRYRVTARTGDDACPLNTLYWDFLIRHRERFRSNHRMAMILKHVDRMDDAERVEITVRGASLREAWGIGAIDASS